MKYSPRIFLIVALSVFVGLCAAYIFAFESILGSPRVSDEYWTRALYDYKHYAAKEIEGPKLVVLSGSNSLFGINSDLLEARMERETVNLAIHADMDINFLYQQASDVLSEGDLLVMPLEYSYYNATKTLTLEFVLYMTAFGDDIYLRKLSLIDYLMFIKDVPKTRVWRGLVEPLHAKRLRLGQKVLYTGPKGIVSDVLRNNQRLKRVVYTDYSHKSLNLKGDIVASRSAHKVVHDIVNLPDKHEPYLNLEDGLSDHFIRHFKRIQALAEERKAQLVLTWPVSIRHAGLDLTTQKGQLRIERLISLLSDNGIEIQCNPAFFNLDYRLFYDTAYHLNERGRILRTEALAQCLSQLDDEKPKSQLPIDWEKSLKTVRYHESRMLSR